MEVKSSLCRRAYRRPPAIPKEVFVIESMPATVIGKIFKPELRADQIKRVFREALADIGAATDIQVMPDKKHGTLAVISLPDSDERDKIAADIQRILGDTRFRTR